MRIYELIGRVRFGNQKAERVLDQMESHFRSLTSYSLPPLLIFLVLLLLAPSTFAQVYRWVDENGAVHYSDTVPDKYRDRAKTIQDESKPGKESPQNVGPAAEVIASAVTDQSSYRLNITEARFYGQVKNRTGQTWSGATLLVRFYRGYTFLGQDIVLIVPGVLGPNGIGTFDRTAHEELAKMYIQSEPKYSDRLHREYTFLGSSR